MADIVIRHGTLVDGTGAPPRRGDLAITDGLISSVGDINDSGARVIDASDLVVAPGFVDVHTHYDAQLHWDPTASPSSQHGVTTVIGGNCGFTLAPLGSDGDAEYLARMFARVEGIPLEALDAGVPFDWSSFAQWLEQHDGRTAVNVGFLVGHCAIRRYVMGERATVAPAMENDLSSMKEILSDALEAGALGLSSSWTEVHVDGDGNPIPSRAAGHDELVALARVVGDHPGTLLEFSPTQGEWQPRHIEVMVDMSRAADRHLNWNTLRAEKPHQKPLQVAYDAAAVGAALIALAPTEPAQGRFTLAIPVLFDSLPGWAETMRLPLGERIQALSDPSHRHALLRAVDSSDLTYIQRSLIDWPSLVIAEGFTPETRRLEGRTVADLAEEQGKDPFDTMIDVALLDGLRTYFQVPALGADDQAWATRVGLWRDTRTIIGGSDAGAHLDIMCGATMQTSLLGDAVRDRGLIPLEEAVCRLSSEPARLYGIRGRGRLAPGFHADVVVFDPATVGPGVLRTRNDLPGGAQRMYAEATGMERVLVNGTEIVNQGRYTGAKPGRVLRSGTDTTTVTARELATTIRP